jgi:short-subunit dehydrogenase
MLVVCKRIQTQKMKKAIGIGATSGISKSLAKRLATDNYIVGITGRKTELLTVLKNENPKNSKSINLSDRC